MMAKEKETEQPAEAVAAPETTRMNAIKDLVNKGYTSGKEKRRVRSVAHAEFLIRSGAINLDDV